MLAGLYYVNRVLAVVAMLYTAYRSFKVLKPVRDDNGRFVAQPLAQVQSRSRAIAEEGGEDVLQIWVSLALLAFLESSGMESFLAWFPFYFEIKTAVLVALIIPSQAANTAVFSLAVKPVLAWGEKEWTRSLSRRLASTLVVGLSVATRAVHGRLLWLVTGEELRAGRTSLASQLVRVRKELCERKAHSDPQLRDWVEGAARAVRPVSLPVSAISPTPALASPALLREESQAAPTVKGASSTAATGGRSRLRVGRGATGEQAGVATADATATSSTDTSKGRVSRGESVSDISATAVSTSSSEVDDTYAGDDDDEFVSSGVPRHTRASISYNTIGAILGHARRKTTTPRSGASIVSARRRHSATTLSSPAYPGTSKALPAVSELLDELDTPRASSISATGAASLR